jgi:hypothetical protein
MIVTGNLHYRSTGRSQAKALCVCGNARALSMRPLPMLSTESRSLHCIHRSWGGYIFVQRLLMNHFASLHTTQTAVEGVETQRTTS